MAEDGDMLRAVVNAEITRYTLNERILVKGKKQQVAEQYNIIQNLTICCPLPVLFQ